MPDQQCTFPCSVNSVPFWQFGTVRRPVDAAWNIGQQRYIDSLLPNQTKIPYNCKTLFTDTLTFQFKTQQNSAPTIIIAAGVPTSYTYTNPAQFHVCKSKIGSSGFPVPGNIVAAFEPELNPAYGTCVSGSSFWGIQNPLFDTFYNPLNGITQQLISYMWSFSFGDFLSQVGGDSGIYFLRFDNPNFDGSITDTWYSEPILVYGTDALLTQSTKRTLLFQGQNNTNKSDILINAQPVPAIGPLANIGFWFNNPLLFPLFNCRVEATILEYEPKGVFLGFLQDQWLQQNTLSSSWETFTLQVGNVFGNTGIPQVFMRIVSKYIEFDNLTINNQFYMYDLGNGGTSPTAAWKIKKSRVNGLCGASISVRYKYPSQLFINPLSEESMIFTPEFNNVFS